MTTTYPEKAQERVSEHLRTLRRYFRRTVAKNGTLSSVEDADRERRMQEYMETGGEELQMTERELVGLLLDGLLGQRKRCSCHSCQRQATNLN